MNQVTKWFSHKLYFWMDPDTFDSMEASLKSHCNKEIVKSVLKHYKNVTLEGVEYYPEGTYEEEGKTRLDNIPAFYLIRMKQKVAKNHTGTLRVYLPVNWNHRFMGIAGAGTNNEVDWFSSVTFNVISWPMAIKNGFAAAVSDNDTGIRLNCDWGFDKNGRLEWDHIESWLSHTLHQTTVLAKELILHIYGEMPSYSYIHGTSGGGRQVVTEGILYPKDYDGLWADAPSINNLDLTFACLWAAVVEHNENHIVALSKYKLAHELVHQDAFLKNRPYDSRQLCWMDFNSRLLGMMTEDGPITRRDLQVMVKTWDGPFTASGKRMAYGFGPSIRQWPLDICNQFYGYFKRKEDGHYFLMPIAEQSIRWFAHDPDFDVYECSYETYEQLYNSCRKEFGKIDFNDSDFTGLGKNSGRIMYTQGTGDCVVPYQAAIDYYENAMDYYPSEKMMNDHFRMFMPDMAGHSILDWSGAAVSCSDGMKSLMAWVEEGIAPVTIPTVRYDFKNDTAFEESEVSLFNQWQYKKMLK